MITYNLDEMVTMVGHSKKRIMEFVDNEDEALYVMADGEYVFPHTSIMKIREGMGEPRTLQRDLFTTSIKKKTQRKYAKHKPFKLESCMQFASEVFRDMALYHTSPVKDRAKERIRIKNKINQFYLRKSAV